nr:molybdate ABC transporter substrate-binding protein [Bisgaardia hudsonensis]
MKKHIFITALSIMTALSTQAKITVFAAASMTNALEEVKTQYLQINPKAEIDLSFASSSTLARQISQGAPANIFISANQKWTDFLEKKEAIVKESRVNLVGNRLVMIAPKESNIMSVDLASSKWQSTLDNSYLAVGDPDHVPAGKYAKSAFIFLKQWDNLEAKLARANNVRGALALVEQGESPLGVVYATDAQASKKVKVVAIFPEDSHSPIVYPVTLIKGQDTEESKVFLSYLTSPESKKIFEKFGFSVP